MQITIPAETSINNPARKFEGCFVTALEYPDLLYLAHFRYTPGEIRSSALAELERRRGNHRGFRSARRS